MYVKNVLEESKRNQKFDQRSRFSVLVDVPDTQISVERLCCIL